MSRFLDFKHTRKIIKKKKKKQNLTIIALKIDFAFFGATYK